MRKVVLLAPAFATALEQAETYQRAFGHPLQPEIDEARKNPLAMRTVDFLTCKQAPVLNATFLDGYAELPPQLAARTGKPTLVIVAGKDEVVPDLATQAAVRREAGGDRRRQPLLPRPLRRGSGRRGRQVRDGAGYSALMPCSLISVVQTFSSLR